MGYKDTIRKDEKGNVLPVGVYWKKQRVVHYWRERKALRRKECVDSAEAQTRVESGLGGYIVTIPAHYQINVAAPRINQPYHRISVNANTFDAALATLADLLIKYPKVDRRLRANKELVV